MGFTEHKYSMRKIYSNERELLKTTELGKDLGVIIKTELKFSKHIKIQVIKANRMMKLIHRSYEYTDGETLVKPHLQFNNIVLFPRLIKDRKLNEGVQKSH